jgi:hypothetical protein
MTRIFTISLFSAFFFGWFRTSASLWSRFTPFFGISTYFIGSSGITHLLYVSILISTAIFWEVLPQADLIDGGRYRSLRYIPICVFLVAESARSPSPGAKYVLGESHHIIIILLSIETVRISVVTSNDQTRFHC